MPAQLLDAPGPRDLLEVVRRLTLLQIDPPIAPSADLVAGSRLGSAYDSAQVKQALEQDPQPVRARRVHPPDERPALYLAGAADWPPWDGTRAWIRDNAAFRRTSSGVEPWAESVDRRRHREIGVGEKGDDPPIGEAEAERDHGDAVQLVLDDVERLAREKDPSPFGTLPVRASRLRDPARRIDPVERPLTD